MNYIPDKELYKAVMFAKKMMREGTPPGKAISISGNYYGYSASEINSAMHSGEKKKRKSEPFYWWVIGTEEYTYEGGRYTGRLYHLDVKKATLSSYVAYNRSDYHGLGGFYDDHDRFWQTLNEHGFKTKKEAEEWAQSEECEKIVSEQLFGFSIPLRFGFA